MMRQRLVRPLLFVGCITALAVFDQLGPFSRHADDRTRYHNVVATIVHIIDGNTFDIDLPDGAGRATRVRLSGIDCPEVAMHPGEIDAWFGPEARDYMQEHLEGRPVRLALDPNRPTRDEEGRLLAFAYDAAGDMVNERLVADGMAYAYGGASGENMFLTRFREVERRARRDRVGLWDGVRPNQMPFWRQAKVKYGVLDG